MLKSCNREHKQIELKLFSMNNDCKQEYETIIDKTYPVESLRRCGLYTRCSKCFECLRCLKWYRTSSWFNDWMIQILMFIYHIANNIAVVITYASHNDLIHTDWCLSIDLNIAILQVESAVLYAFGVWALRHQYGTIRNYLQKYYKPLNRKKKILLFFMIIIVWITGFLTGADDENWQFGKKGWPLEFTLYASDLLRYIPTAMIIFILYGHLDSFDGELTKFKKETNTDTAGLTDGSVLKIDDIDEVVFKTKFKTMTKPYKSVLSKFMWFIFIFFVFNLVTLACILWSLVLNYQGKGCKLSAFYYIHYIIEIIYFLGLWITLAYILNQNYQLIIDYKHDLIDKTTMDIKIIQYLDLVIDYKSPFAVFGMINPSNQKFGGMLTGVVVPILAQIYQIATKYTVEA